MTELPDIFWLDTIGIRISAVLFLCGVILSYLLVSWREKQHGYSQISGNRVLAVCLFGGLIPGRLFWVLENFSVYAESPLKALYVMDGGFDFCGVMIGVLTALTAYSVQVRRMPVRLLDTVMPCLLLCAALFRLGRVSAQPGVWFGILFYLFVFLFLFLFYTRLNARGISVSVSMLTAGAERLVSNLYGLDSHASNALIPSLTVIAFGLVLLAATLRQGPGKPVILFDLDGTLMDSEQMVADCFLTLFVRHGRGEEFTDEIRQKVFGPPLRDMMAELFPDQDPDRMVKEYQTIQNGMADSGRVKLFDGTRQILESLKRKGYILGIVSSRMTESCRFWTGRLGIAGLFAAILGRDSFERPKPYPDGILAACDKLNTGHDSCIYIGDNGTDVEAAKHAGVYAVGYVSNEDKFIEILDAKPNAVIYDLRELNELLKENHAWTYDRM